MNDATSIYISHAWGGESEIITQQIVERFKKENLTITIDKNDLGYRESITKFMENLGEADAIILVISNKYLHSEYCMFELLQIYDNKNILERIFPVVLDEVSIAKSTDRLELVKYWENQSSELESKIRELQSLGHIDGITEDLNLYYNIRNKIAKLTSILKDINTLNIGVHRDSDFSHLVTAVKKQLTKNQPLTQTTDSSKIIVPSQDHLDPSKKKITEEERGNNKLNTIFKILVIAALFLPVGFLLNSLSDKNDLTKNHEPVLFDSLDITPATDTQNEKSILIEDKKSIKRDNFVEPEPKSVMAKNEFESNKTIVLPPDDKSVDLAQKPVSSINREDTKEKVSESLPNAESDIGVLAAKEYTIPTQYIEVKFKEDISSNSVTKGQTIYLENITPVKIGTKAIIPNGSVVKCLVKDASSSNNGSVGLLSLQIESVQAINKEWVPLQYPVISQKKRAEIIFKKGQIISKIKLSEFKIKT